MSLAFKDPDVVDYIEANCLRELDLKGVVYKRIPVGDGWRALRERVSRRLESRESLDLEDESTPDLFIDLSAEHLSTLTSQSRSLRRNIRHVENSGFEFNVERDLERACGLTRRQLYQLCQNSQEKWTAYSIMCAAISVAVETRQIRSWVFSSAGRVVGLYLAELINDSTCGLYCAITGTRARGWTEFMDLMVLGELRTAYEGASVRRVLIGGCESPGVAEYVDKLRPGTAEVLTTAIGTGPLASQEHERERHDHTDEANHEAHQSQMAAL
ncbi:MAG: hypothetical protein AAF467_24705 [Actinomycetota bacterium]